MIRYTFNTQVTPPAPFVLLTLRNLVNGAEVRDVPAQLDSGADRTVVPLKYVQQLALVVSGAERVVGFGSAPIETPLYSIELGIQPLAPSSGEVIASSGEPWILLGRDVSNGYRLLLDGPGLALDIG